MYWELKRERVNAYSKLTVETLELGPWTLVLCLYG